MTTCRIPFNRVVPAGDELRYVAQAIAHGHLAGDGPFTQRCAELLERELGARRVLLTTSGTHALELCALLLDFRPGDEVIVPAFAFVTTANAFVLRGARPVFVDVRRDTLNLDERAVQARITPRTKAIVALHYAGVGCELDELVALARARGVALVEDNAHGLFGSYRGKPLGSFGALAAQSFHETKNVTCGEGGALVVNDARWIERAEILREKGTDRSRFHRGQVDRYTWVDLGSSYLPAEILAAFLLAQLERRGEIQARRRELWQRYLQGLTGWAERQGVELPRVPAHCSHPAHLFHLLLPDLATRQRLIAHLARAGILAVFHYQPLHLSRMGRALGGRPGSCPVTEDVCDRLLRLPLYPGLSNREQEEVLESVCAFRGFTRRSCAV